MKITFVYPDVLEIVPDYKGAFYIGIALLSAVLKRDGHETSLIHITDPAYSIEHFQEDLRQHQPDLIAFSSTTNGFPKVRTILGYLKELNCIIPTICGGVHPTLAPQESIETPGLSMISVGESEETLSELCAAMEKGAPLENIQNLWLNRNGKVVKNPMRPLCQDLDNIPFADRDIYDYPNLYFERQGDATVMASRGCPFSCSYCSNKALRSLYGSNGKYVRFRSVDNVIREIEGIKNRYGFVRRIHFDDDILFLKRAWTEEFVRAYATRIDLPFCCNIHPSLCNERNMDMLSQAGCDELRIGLESGSSYIRKHVLNRTMDEDKIIRAFALARDHGIKTMSFNMIGLPQENASHILESIKLNARAGADDLQLTVFYPYPGSELYEMCKRENIITERTYDNYYVDSILDLTDISPSQLQMFKRYFITLTKTYKQVFRMPKVLATPIEWSLDAVLTNRLAPLLLQMVRPAAHQAGVLLGRILRRGAGNDKKRLRTAAATTKGK